MTTTTTTIINHSDCNNTVTITTNNNINNTSTRTGPSLKLYSSGHHPEKEIYEIISAVLLPQLFE